MVYVLWVSLRPIEPAELQGTREPVEFVNCSGFFPPISGWFYHGFFYLW
jgi:hypothetical protein